MCYEIQSDCVVIFVEYNQKKGGGDIGRRIVGGTLLDDTINVNRASVKTEYKMMRTCIYEFQDRDTCICAVESMSGFIDAEKALLYGHEWLKEVLKNKYDNCKD